MPGVQSHREKWDGSGYPRGCPPSGFRSARLPGVSDFIDALTSARACREPLSVGEVVAMIRDGAGSHFDPAIGKVVARLHERGELLPPPGGGS